MSVRTHRTRAMSAVVLWRSSSKHILILTSSPNRGFNNLHIRSPVTVKYNFYSLLIVTTGMWMRTGMRSSTI